VITFFDWIIIGSLYVNNALFCLATLGTATSRYVAKYRLETGAGGIKFSPIDARTTAKIDNTYVR